MTKPLFIYTTFPDADSAAKVAKSLLEKRLVACANILPQMRSLYVWKGEVNDEPEVAMILKTTNAQYAAMEQEILSLHSYETPCIVALPIDQGNPSYLAWITAETGPKE